MSVRWLLVVGMLTTFTGCATRSQPENLPGYHWVDERTALADLRTRAESVKTVSAECAITLTRPDGQSVQFDGVLVMQKPDRVRLRAWKFNRAVFDLTLNDDGLWVMTPDEPGRRDRVLPATVRAAAFVRELSLLTGGFFTSEPPPEMIEVRAKQLLLRSWGTMCEVDRATLTPRRFVAHYDEGEKAFELKLGKYQLVNGIPWASRLEAISEMGRVVVEQREVEINGELAEGAFVPPSRAEKRQ